MDQEVTTFKRKKKRIFTIAIIVALLQPPAFSQYSQQVHRDLLPGEIALYSPGYCGTEGASYLLMNDIRSDKSVLFLGNNITLDLNGYTISYAEGNYSHIPNFDFEEGLEHWDVSLARGAMIVDKKVQVMIGDHALHLNKGDEIVSAYIDLPVEGRSYFATCGIAAREMQIKMGVEDSLGNEIRCVNHYGPEQLVSCPADSLSPRLGGGITYVHLSGMPAGPYRVRIKALTDCIIDCIDIRPALDVGIGIVGEIRPGVNYRDLYSDAHGAFYDYAGNDEKTIPREGIPVADGEGTATIKNGIIRNGTEGILSWGIQSTAASSTLILENIKIITTGINANSVDAPCAKISRCTFDATPEFIINRHGSSNYNVDLWGKKSSEVAYSEFFGGQGCLAFKGDSSRIHHNFFANRQTVTNHYSIMAMGDHSAIYSNKIVPETGSGIEIYVHRDIDIFDNEISIQASPPTCEYGHSDYSTAALRIADYNAAEGASNAAFNNRFHNNKVKVTGKDYPEYTDYIPMAWAVFYSASGGENFIYENDIEVEDLTPNLKNETAAFYIGGGCRGGLFKGNRITANIPAFWIAGRYGPAENVDITSNIIVKSASADTGYKPVRIGWYTNTARGILFKSNIFNGSGLEIDRTDANHSYWVSWPLTIRITDRRGKPLQGKKIRITGCNGDTMFEKTSDMEGIVKTELPEYHVDGKSMQQFSPFTIWSGNKKITVILDSNKEVIIRK